MCVDKIVVGAVHRFVDDGKRAPGTEGGLEVERSRKGWRKGLVVATVVLSSCFTKQAKERENRSVFMVLDSSSIKIKM